MTLLAVLFSTAILVGSIPHWDVDDENLQQWLRTANEWRAQKPAFIVNRGLDVEPFACCLQSLTELVVSKSDFENLQIPTLSVFGSLEENYLSRYQELEALLPDIELFVIEGARHGQTYPRPEFLVKVREFLAKH